MDFGKNLVFVCHAASYIALARCFLRDKSCGLFPGPCSVTKLVREGDLKKWVLDRSCDVSHLEDELCRLPLYLPWGFSEDLQKEIDENFKF